MMELKHQLMLNKEMSWVPCYLKSEADKIIRHHKYKRCMAMAKWCRASANLEKKLDAKPYQDYYERWFFRWLELADKFKEEK